MKLTRFVPVTALLLAFGLLSGSEAGDGSGVLAQDDQLDCTVTVQPGESIQRAIDAAAPGAVICLGAGTYRENLIIKKGLTLRGTGANPDEVRIVGAEEEYPVILIECEQVIEVQLENLAVVNQDGTPLWTGDSLAYVGLGDPFGIEPARCYREVRKECSWGFVGTRRICAPAEWRCGRGRNGWFQVTIYRGTCVQNIYHCCGEGRSKRCRLVGPLGRPWTETRTERRFVGPCGCRR